MERGGGSVRQITKDEGGWVPPPSPSSPIPFGDKQVKRTECVLHPGPFLTQLFCGKEPQLYTMVSSRILVIFVLLVLLT